MVRRSVLASGLCLAAAGAPANGQPGGADDRPARFVCVDEEHRAVRSEPQALGPADRVWRNLERLAGDRSLTHCWVWTDRCPPLRVARGDRLAGVCDAERLDRLDRLTIRAPLPDHGAAGDRPRLAREVEIVAAPAAMWREAPLGLLPKWPAVDGALSLPRSRERWRVQAGLDGRLSRLRDAAPDEAAVDLVLLPAVAVSVQVTADRAPLVGARLSLVQPGRFATRTPPELLGFEAADDAGAVTLAVTERERSLVVVSSPTRAAAAFRRFDEVPSLVELGAGYTVSGAAVDSKGDPVADVGLVGLSRIPGGGGLMQRLRGAAGADGRFRIPGFAPGAALLRTEEDAELFFSRELDLGQSIDLGQIVLAAQEHVWLSVLSRGSRRPVADASVLPAGGEWTAVDEDGTARVNLVLGREIRVVARGHLAAGIALPDGEGRTAEDPFVVELEPAFTVEGTFVATDGLTPAAAGRFVARREKDNRSSHHSLAPDGSFSVDLPEGAWELELSGGNAGTRRLRVAGSAGEVRNLGVVAAPASAWLSGHVVGPELIPVAEATVSRVRTSEMGPLLAWALGNVDQVTTNAEGYFELFGLPAGSSTIRVEAEGFAPLDFEVSVDALDRVDVGMVELSRGRRVLVRSDVEEGQVVVDTGLLGHPRDLIHGSLRDGEAVVETVPDGSFLLQVLEDGVPVCEREGTDETGDVRIRCDRSTTTLTGRVTLGERPGDGMLLWQRQGRPALPEGRLTTRGGPLPRSQVVTNRSRERKAMLDGEGRYRIESVLPGAWEVIWMPLAGGQQDVREVDVPDGPGVEVAIDLDYGGVSVVGAVMAPDDAPAAHATVDVFPGRRAVVADDAGRFRVLGLMPGRYQLRARLRDRRSRLVDVELRPGDSEAVELRLADDPPADEIVVELGGAGAGFCFVESDTGVSQVVRIENGVARQKLSPPLADRLRIACRADGRWALTGWQGTRQALDEGVDLDPGDSTSTLVLLGEDGGAPIGISGPGGWDLGALRIWFGGATAFRSGETIPHLPAGSYTVSWGGRSRIVHTERGRSVEVEIDP